MRRKLQWKSIHLSMLKINDLLWNPDGLILIGLQYKLQWKLHNGKHTGEKISVDLQRFFELRNSTYDGF